jgi:hypothetical protein
MSSLKNKYPYNSNNKMTAVLKTKLVFLDSDSVVTDGVGTDFRVNFPSGQITCGDGQFLRISLQNFSMLRNFYSINEHNNTVAVRTDTNATYGSVSIDPGEYEFYYDMVVNFGTKLATYFQTNQTAGGTYTLDTASVSPTQNANSQSTTNRIMRFTIDSSAPHGMTTGGTILQCRDYDTSSQDPAEVQRDFNDSYEILGGRRITDAGDLTTQSFTLDLSNPNKITVTGFYPMQRFTQEDLYLHSDLAASNFASHHFNRANSANTLRLDSTTVFAKMPVYAETVRYDASNYNEYFFDYYGDNLTDMRLYIRDCNGRPIPEAGVTQSTFGNLNFTLVLRIDTVAYGRTGFSNLQGPDDDLLDISSDARRTLVGQGKPPWRVRGLGGLNGQFFSKQASAGPQTGEGPGFPSH